jgi:hypothetical protein
LEIAISVIELEDFWMATGGFLDLICNSTKLDPPLVFWEGYEEPQIPPFLGS